ncbi:MAG: type II secretion system major pseudopilin GspG [Pirellulales bacterium]
MQRLSQVRRRRSRAGFTLMEVLLVLAILVILGSLAAVSFRGVMSDADSKAAKSQVGLFKPAIEVYQLTFKQYPSSLTALVQPPPEVDQDKWQKIIAPSFPSGTLPKDPWGNEYQLVVPGTHNPNGYDVFSVGPDGAPGTADDVGNWD